MPKKLYTNKHYNTSGQAHELTFSVYRRQELFLDEKVCDIFLTELELARKEYIWQAGGGFDRNIWNPDVVLQSINYIEANPVRKKLSLTPEACRWSSAYARVNKKGVIPDGFTIPVKMINY
jgi:hypothetical protein